MIKKQPSASTTYDFHGTQAGNWLGCLRRLNSDTVKEEKRKVES